MLKDQLEFAAADGRFEAGGSEVPLGLEAEVIAPQPAAGRVASVRVRGRRATQAWGKGGCGRVAAVHAACGDVGRSGGLSVSAGCVWVVRRAGLIKGACREPSKVRAGAGVLS